jgi:hypothetical protein
MELYFHSQIYLNFGDRDNFFEYRNIAVGTPLACCDVTDRIRAESLSLTTEILGTVVISFVERQVGTLQWVTNASHAPSHITTHFHFFGRKTVSPRGSSTESSILNYLWAGHVARMGEGRGAYRVLMGGPEGRRPLGRPRRRWEDNIKMDLQEVGWGAWTGLIWLRIGTGGGLL